MMDFKLIAESRVNPTEDEAKVERALHNIFPSEPIHKETSHGDTSVLRVTGTDLDSLSTLRSLIRQDRIRSAARSILLRTLPGERIRLYLNKQAAYMGRVSFCGPTGESPHGPISIEIDTPDPQSVIDFLAFNPAQGFSREPIGRRKR
jgi:predicted RNA binding protein with dsRBD fold (UPF0201 family)